MTIRWRFPCCYEPLCRGYLKMVSREFRFDFVGEARVLYREKYCKKNRLRSSAHRPTISIGIGILAFFLRVDFPPAPGFSRLLVTGVIRGSRPPYPQPGHPHQFL